MWPDGWKGSIGLEPTPDLFVQHMVSVFREVRRVMRHDATLWLNLGDSYNSSSSNQQNGANVDRPCREGAFHNQGRRERNVSGLKPKDLIGIPWRVAFALQADGWWLRSDIIWAKPNPMPESVTDRPTKSHEYIFLLTKSARYFFDQEAVREPNDYDEKRTERIQYAGKSEATSRFIPPHPNGRNIRTVWNIATAPFPEAHFATFPPKLVQPCIRAGTSEHGVCPECGAPWVRQVERTAVSVRPNFDGQRGTLPKSAARDTAGGDGVDRCGNASITTTGWLASCDHEAEPVPALVMDPFSGSGTVGQVAIEERRDFIGIELNPDYCKMAERRTRQVQVRAF